MEYAVRQEKPKTTSKAVVSGKSNPDMLLSNLPYTPATDLSQQFNVVQVESESVLKSQSKEASDSIPEVKESEGSAFKASSQKEPKESEKKQPESANSSSSKPANHYSFKWTPFDEKAQKAFEEKEQKRRLSKPTNYYSTRPRVSDSALTGNQAQNQLEAIGLNTSSIPDRIQVNTNVNLSGEASVENLSAEQNKTGKELQTQKNQASKDIHKDYGENDILKKPSDHELKTTYKFQTVNFTVSPVEDFQVEGIDVSGINSEFKPVIESNIGAETEKYHSAQSEYDQRVSEEENSSETRIEEEKNKSKESQLKTVKETQTEVNKSRAEWQKELNKTETDFSQKAGNQAETTMVGIRTEKASGEAAAQSHIDKANSDARREKEKAEREAEEKKSEKKRESKGFFGWVADKASAFINTLKEAVNYIFTKLREAVKAIFEVAKKLVLTVLEAARKAIVILIKSFAVALKGFLDIALAAFPVIRDRFKARIDNFVAASERLVNQVFDLFKKTVTAILDFLASVVDGLLGALQAVYNFVLDAINIIVAGIIEIMRGLANLVSSAMAMPDNFMGQISEEFLGMDVTQPLPFEKRGLSDVEKTDSDYFDLLDKSSYDEDDFYVNPVTTDMELSPELLFRIENVNDNGEVYFGANDNTTDSFKQSYAVSEDSENTTSGGESQKIPEDPYAQADWFINSQNSIAPADTSKQSMGGEAATADLIPEDMKLVGPWTPAVRLYYLKEQMWAGIKKNWEENKWKYIGIGAAIVLGITALAIVTGGAIFALIPPALKIFAAIMMGAALLKASGFFKSFMTDGWAGKIALAGKALARAIGIILMELIFIILFDSAALFKVLKTTVKSGVKGALSLAKSGAKSTLTAGKNALVATGKGFVRQAGKAKFLIQGIGKSAVKGAKSLDELGENLAKRFKFKGFKFVIKGFRFYLYGSVNPWVLLASGDIEFVKDADVIKKGNVRGDITFLKNGQELTGKLITNKDVLPKSAYKRIFEMFTGETSKGKVIHHMIEQQMIGFVAEITQAFVNNAKRLKGMPQGMINEVVHLSKVRTMWNDMYKAIDGAIDIGMTNDQVIKALLNFAKYTDDFIEASFKYSDEMGETLTKDALREFTENWLKKNLTDKAIKESINNNFKNL